MSKLTPARTPAMREVELFVGRMIMSEELRKEFLRSPEMALRKYFGMSMGNALVNSFGREGLSRIRGFVEDMDRGLAKFVPGPGAGAIGDTTCWIHTKRPGAAVIEEILTGKRMTG